MSVYIKILNSKASFSKAFTASLKEFIEKILEDYDLTGGEVSVIIADNDLLQQFNREYREKDAPTDVLSFSYLETNDQRIPGEEEFAVGDIYISLEKACNQAETAGHSLEREITLLVTHGMLHILGFDHGDAADARLMQEKEQALMEKYNHVCAGGEMDE